VCQITSNPFSDANAIVLSGAAFSTGGLQQESYARPGKLFTAHESLIVSTVGTVKPEVLLSIRSAVIRLIQKP